MIDPLIAEARLAARDKEIERLSYKGKLKDAVVEAANACITAWDDAKWPPSIPLRKALAALDASVSERQTPCEHSWGVPVAIKDTEVCVKCGLWKNRDTVLEGQKPLGQELSEGLEEFYGDEYERLRSKVVK